MGIIIIIIIFFYGEVCQSRYIRGKHQTFSLKGIAQKAQSYKWHFMVKSFNTLSV